MITLEIDGKRVEAEAGSTILNAAQQVGIQIPYFCYHKEMEPYGGCRLCMVEVTENGFTRLQPSCAYPVKNDIIVKTSTERLIKGRKILAELLLARCPNIDSVINLADSLGVKKTRFRLTDSDCVLCGLCVRVCRNVAKVGAIDFVGRGRNRRPATPFDMPSDDCIGCGSCAYVCPTGAMKMEYENVLRWRKLPGPLRKCRYMRMGFISYKVCANDFQCWNCEVDQRMEDLSTSHPVFMLREARAKEREKFGGFEMLSDRLYDEGHIWVKRINGTVRMGIDDFTRQIVGQINDIKLPSVNSFISQGDPLCIISANGKTLHLYAPLDGKIVDINPDIIDNPSLISMAPHRRGWILMVEPSDIVQASKELLSGRSATEWMTHESRKFYDFVRENMEMELSPERPIPPHFLRTLEPDVWNEMDKTFFMVRRKRRAKLHSIGQAYPTPKKVPKSS
ncbi:MAG TPA: 2Fe-2S iron-sulfur cluster-binding protein [Desulfobacterales bacterium]|nr:2Fe-2S iron-sulfur cluster-binding protein [Desulfobacterales bacterium]